MTERQRNKQAVARSLNKLGIGYTEELLNFIVDEINDSYVRGLKQKQFDLLMKIDELEQERSLLRSLVDKDYINHD